MIYCVVPPELGEDAYKRLVEHYRDNPNVKVIMDRRPANAAPVTTPPGRRPGVAAGARRATSTSDLDPQGHPMTEPLPRGSETSLVLTHLMQPMDANYLGNIHGGVIMKLIDEAAGACAFRFCRTNIVTAAIDRIDFHHPVQVGNLVRLLANVNYAGRTSVEVGVRVEAEDLTTGVVTHTNSAYLVFVALSGTGRPIPVPQFTPQTDQQKMWHDRAAERRRKRLAEREPED